MSLFHHSLKFFPEKTDVIFRRLVRSPLKGRAFAAGGPTRGLELGWHPFVFVVEEEVPGRVVDAFDGSPISPRVALSVEEFSPRLAGEEIFGGGADQDVEAVWRPAGREGVPAGRGGCRVREVRGGRGGCRLH